MMFVEDDAAVAPKLVWRELRERRGGAMGEDADMTRPELKEEHAADDDPGLATRGVLGSLGETPGLRRT